MRNRLLSTLLALCMVLTLLPAQVIALEMDSDSMEFLPPVVENEEPEALEEAELSEEVELGGELPDEWYTEQEVLVEPSAPEVQNEAPYTAEEEELYVFDPATGTIGSCWDKSITTANIPSSINGVTVRSIANGAFEGCSELISVVIPDSVISIGVGAFSGCSKLMSTPIRNCKKTPKKFCSFSAGGINKIKRFLAEKEYSRSAVSGA